MSFVSPEEYVLTYIFIGKNCEVDITVTSRGEQYIKVLGSVDGEGDVYKIGKTEN